MIEQDMNERPEPETMPPRLGFELLDQVKSDLDDVEAGLGRLEDGTYGQCEACGGEIDEVRLATLPATRYCVSHQAVGGPPGRSPAVPGDSGGAFPLDSVP